MAPQNNEIDNLQNNVESAPKKLGSVKERAQAFVNSVDKTGEEKNKYEQVLNSWNQDEDKTKNEYKKLAGTIKTDTVKNLKSFESQLDANLKDIKTTFKEDTNWWGDVTDEGKKKIQNKAQELKTNMDKSSQEVEDLEITERVYEKESFSGFPDGETKQVRDQFKQSQKDYIHDMLGTNDDVEDLAAIVGEKLDIQDRIKNIPTLISSMGPKEALQFLKDTHQSIDDNNFQSDKNKADYKALADALHGIIKDKLLSLPQTEENKALLLSFAKVITDREGNIDDDLKDPKIATEVLLKAMMFNNGAVDQLLKTGKINLKDEKAEKSDFRGIYTKFSDSQKCGLPIYVDKNGKQEQVSLTEIAGFNINIPAGKKYEDLSADEKVKISTLVRFDEQAGTNLEKIPNVTETREIDKKLKKANEKLEGINKKLGKLAQDQSGNQLNNQIDNISNQVQSEKQNPKIEEDPKVVSSNVDKILSNLDSLEQKVGVFIDPNVQKSKTPEQIKKEEEEIIGILGTITNDITSAQASMQIFGERIRADVIKMFQDISVKAQTEMLDDTFKNISSTNLFDLFDGKSEGEEIGLKGIDSQIYDTYLDIEGIGLFDFSDENIANIKEKAKMGAFIAVAVVSMVTLNIACPGLGLLAIAAITAAITTGAGTLIYQNGFDSTQQMAIDLGSEFAVNLGTNMIGGKIGQAGVEFILNKIGSVTLKQALGLEAGASLKQVTLALGTTEGVKKITPFLITQGIIDSTDFAQGTYVEYLRQRYILGKDISYANMLESGVTALMMGKIIGGKFHKIHDLQQKIHGDIIVVKNPGVGNNIVLKPEEANLLISAGLIDEKGNAIVDFRDIKEVINDSEFKGIQKDLSDEKNAFGNTQPAKGGTINKGLSNEVIANIKLTEEERVLEVEHILDRKLTDYEKHIIKKAYNIILKMGSDDFSNIIKLSLTEVANLKKIGFTDIELNNLVKLGIFGKELAVYTRSVIDINQNHPYLNIFTKLQNGGEYSLIAFNGVKKLNDITSQAFTDRVLNRFKEEISGESVDNGFDSFDYKTCFCAGKLSSTDLQIRLNKVFQEELANSEYAGKIDPDQNSLIVNIESTKIENQKPTQQDIINSIALIRSNIERTAMNNEGAKFLDFQGTVDLYSGMLKDYREGSGHTESCEYRDAKYKVKDGILIKEFQIDTGEIKTERIQIIDNGNLNVRIITLVRKGELPDNLGLTQNVRLWQKSCIANGEFIAPYYKQEGFDWENYISESDIKTYQRILNGDATSDEIIKFQEKNYKGALSKYAFYEKIVSGEGHLMYVDIKDMGSYNLLDFYKRIDEANNMSNLSKEQKRLYALNRSGEEVTQVFIELNVKIKDYLKNEFPGQEIDTYIGGDEIGIFIGGRSLGSEETRKITQKILDIIGNGKLNLEARITERGITQKVINENRNNGSNLVKSLDELTGYSKIVEKRISQLKETIKLRGDNFTEYNKIKDFRVYIDNVTGNYKIEFLNKPFGKKVENNIFNLDEIVDTDKFVLKSESPLIEFLEQKMGIYKIDDSEEEIA